MVALDGLEERLGHVARELGRYERTCGGSECADCGGCEEGPVEHAEAG
jgi:hypothetical protein